MVIVRVSVYIHILFTLVRFKAGCYKSMTYGLDYTYNVGINFNYQITLLWGYYHKLF